MSTIVDSAATSAIHVDPATLKAATNNLEDAVVPEKQNDYDVNQLFVTDKATREAALQTLLSMAEKQGPQTLLALGLGDAIIRALNDKKSPAAREAAASTVRALANGASSVVLESISVSSGLFDALLEAAADKTPAVRTAAVAAGCEVIKSQSPWATSLVLPIILRQIKSAGKWQVKTASLSIFNEMIKSAPSQVGRAMPDIIPVLSEAIWDTKADVKNAARASLTKATALISNKDIERFIPALINALINPVEEVPKTIQLLSATTFVSEVDAPTLSLMVPLLARGLNEKLTATKRKVAVITDNMAKLVDSEETVRPFLPLLLPGLIKIETVMGDPEARGVVNKAIATLRQVGKVPAGGDGTNLPPLKVVEATTMASSLTSIYKKSGIVINSSPVLTYISIIGAALVNGKNFEEAEWNRLIPYLTLLTTEVESKDIAREWLLKSANEGDDENTEEYEEEEGEDLCNCTFSLAYGAKILLNTATLHLKRGHRYGLCGKNGTGKSTLMRAITNGQVEGFPSPDEVRTFYVEHDIDGSEAETSVVQFILSDERVLADEKEVRETLASVGFNDERQKHAIGSLSGGWKMKLALARAMLFKADILLLDEPTNHLDVVNIAWLENYLTGLKNCTSIIVSHDSSFLNHTITDVLHLNRFKLKRYRGNLERFVEQVPEAKSYYTLEAAEDYKFKLPDPPLLEGVKTKEKSLMKMRKVGFQYPSQKVQQLYDITLQVSLSSRVAVLGPNGSGKSTLVKLLIGDLEPNMGGEIWKHPNLVIGYVAQHAFHHIDNHLDKTPLEYMLWRYQTGEDLEEMSKANRVITEAEQQKMKDGSLFVVEGQKRFIEEIIARKKLKQSYEYEVSFKGLSSTENVWIPRDELIKRGFEKKVLEVDTREAQRLGLLRPLVRREIEKHFADFGLEPEFVSHNTMRGLSGGQKVKIVLGAATWRRPHVVCLDEPTNYLDRESLAALIEALKTFQGGVLVITHNRDFSESLCKEVWAMRDGHLEASGHNWVEGQGSGPRIDKADGEQEDQYDAMGNKIDVSKKKKLTASEARKAKKDRIARRKRGEEDGLDDEFFDHERIPERVVHARGTGAHGYFQVFDNSMEQYTLAKVLTDPSRTTPVFVRFSTVQGSRGSADTVRDVRGFATKFYTEEGNWDLVGNNIPVFFIQDAIKFPDIIHAVKPEPKNEVPQGQTAHNNFWDFAFLTPETTHMLLWIMSDRSIPRSYRMMQGFGVNTFTLINAESKRVFVKFHWLPELGVHSFVWDEALKIAGQDPDFHRKDLEEAINNGAYPEWTLAVQIIEEVDEHKFDFDILDDTKIWPEDLVPLKKVGKLVLNRTVDEFFPETEQIAFCTSHVVPGIGFSDDPVLQGRNFSYFDTQVSRLGINWQELPINRPVCPVFNFNRDGRMRHRITNSKVNYHPNRFEEIQPVPKEMGGYASHRDRINGIKERTRGPKFQEHFNQAQLFWNSMSGHEKAHIINAFSFELAHCDDPVVYQRMCERLRDVDFELARQVALNVGGPEPNKVRPNHGKVAKGLSQMEYIPETPSIKGRRVAILVADGFNTTEVNEIRAALKAGMATTWMIGVRRGTVYGAGETAKSNSGMSTDHSFESMRSTMFDAIIIPSGHAHIAAISKMGRVVHWIREAFGHLKPIAAIGEGVTFLREVVQLPGVSYAAEESNDVVDSYGVVTTRKLSLTKETYRFVKGDTTFVGKFGLAVSMHRNFQRETDGLVAHVPF